MNIQSVRRKGAFVWLMGLLATLFVASYLVFQLASEASSGRYTEARSKAVEDRYVRESFGDLRHSVDPHDMLHSRPGLLAEYGNLPLSFEPNRGQARGTTEFFARGEQCAIALNARQASLLLHSSPKGAEEHLSRQHSRLSRGVGDSAETASVSFTLVGAKDVGRSVLLNEIPGKSNYFAGKDPSKWITNIPHYSRIQYKDVYPGIDLVYHGNQQQLESDFIVSPGANPKTIRVAVNGSRRLERSDKGDLILKTSAGQLRLYKPVAHQLINHVPTEVASRFRWISESEFGFEIPAYDATKELVIDPVLTYSTLLGGSVGENGSDFGLSIAVDSAGSAYVTGTTVTTDFPTANPLQSTNHGALDAFITKLNPTGTGLVYSTYLGGSADDWGQSISVDAAGNVYITGMTVSPDFPTTSGVVKSTCTTTDQFGIVRADVFITKLNASGSSLDYSTCLGGSADDEGAAIAVDAQGNAYIAGGTNSADFPVTSGAFQTTFAGGDITAAGYLDAFVSKINASASTLFYSTLPRWMR